MRHNREQLSNLYSKMRMKNRVGDSPLLQAQGNGPIAMADSTRISRIDFSKQKPTLQSVGSSDEMLSLQEALKQGLAGTTHQLFTAKDDIDGMKRLVHIIFISLFRFHA
uniref:Uncharacterized protein n=1 Tax=Parascaris equorum TaxID=6256 RepID=A0A914RQN4_PAREQ